MMGDWDVVSKVPAAGASTGAPAADPWAVISTAPAGPDRTTWLERFGTGLADPIHGSAQALEHAVPGPIERGMNRFNNWLVDQGVPFTRLPEGGLDEVLAKREQDYQAERGTNAGSFDPLRTVGQTAIPTVISARTGAGPAAAGALSSAMTPVTDPQQQANFWTTKAEDAATGAAAGKALSVLGSAASSAIKPATGAIAPIANKAVQKLVDAGVSLTPGQLFGGVSRRLEEAMSSKPVLGSTIQKAYQKSIETFNRAVANEALKPVGVSIPAGTAVGEDMIKAGQSALDQAYDAALNKVNRFHADAGFDHDMQNLRTLAAEMPPDKVMQLENILQNRVYGRLGPQRNMDARTFKQVESELGTEARAFKRSGAGQGGMADTQVGRALQEAQAIIRQTLERQNPQAAADLAAANKAWSAWQRVEDASIRRPTSNGVFTPGDLLGSIKSWATGTGQKHSLAAGDQMLQPLAKAGQEILPSKMANGGTPERQMWNRLVDIGIGGGAAAGATFHPGAALAGGTAILAAMAPYTKTGGQFLLDMARGLPNTRALVAKGIQQSTQQAAPLAGLVAAEMINPSGAQPTNTLAPMIQPQPAPAPGP